MWGLIIGAFIILNIISTAIILAACVVSGRSTKVVIEETRTRADGQMELASAIAKLRQIEPVSVPSQA